MLRTARGETLGRLAATTMVVAAMACAGATRIGDSQPLTGVDWRLIELNGRPASPAEVSRRPWLRFDADSGRVFGSAGCNRVSGRYTATGTSLQFGAMASTKMACADDALNRQEQEFLEAVQGADRFDIAGDTLVLMKGSDRVARLTR